MIGHLRNRGGALDFADTRTLLVERDTEWNVNKVPQLYFNRVEKAMRGLTRAGINSDLNERRDMALFYLKATGEFDAAVREWEAKPEADKTWTNIKSFISTEYAKENKQNKLTANQFKANAMEEQAEATEELIKKRYLINHLISTMLSGQCFVFLFRQGTECTHGKPHMPNGGPDPQHNRSNERDDDTGKIG
jgi:hypothetical protein